MTILTEIKERKMVAKIAAIIKKYNILQVKKTSVESRLVKLNSSMKNQEKIVTNEKMLYDINQKITLNMESHNSIIMILNSSENEKKKK